MSHARRRLASLTHLYRLYVPWVDNLVMITSQQKKLASVLLISRLDYCNAVLLSFPASIVTPLQFCTRQQARYLTSSHLTNHINGTIRNLQIAASHTQRHGVPFNRWCQPLAHWTRPWLAGLGRGSVHFLAACNFYCSCNRISCKFYRSCDEGFKERSQVK